MKIDIGTLSRLERNELDFSIHYESKFNQALERLKVSQLELETVKRVIELKRQQNKKEE
ncbi:hypothetical protein AB1K84_25275 [Mesobacillus foraminis]|uniref:hypothetical protein n=1 Tax=Mesobacillus foraminis TaxID=279826 RepID=UPI00399F8811